MLALYRDKYADFNVRLFHEKLGKQEGIQLSCSWVKQALQGTGLVARRRKRGPRRRRRPRRPLPGMLLHIDGSKHQSFQDDWYYDLIVNLDDATSEIYYAQLVAEESTRTGDDRSVRGDRAPRPVLRAVQRSWQSFFLHT